jgi:Immunoglobulin-like domain of bacterial spore germination/Sporulation and spore germination
VAVTRALLLVVLALLVAGCSGDENAADRTTDTATVTLPAFSNARVFWLRDGKVWPVRRDIEATDAPTAALGELFAGPSDAEKAGLDATSAVAVAGDAPRVTVEDGVATVEIDGQQSDEALAQIVYTLTDLPGVDSVEIDGRSLTRADFEEQTPAVLVESPLPFDDVASPLRVTGTANTFEATFQYEVVDMGGSVIDGNVVTATSGTGTRGTFDFTTGAFDDISALRFFEFSAKDGSRINEVQIPLGTGS